MKFLAIYFSLLFFSFSSLASLPEVPEGCFRNNIYCSSSRIVKKTINDRERRVIEVNVFAVLDKFDFSMQSILDIFFDFDQWGTYARAEGSDRLKFDRAMSLGTFVDQDGTVVKKQYLNTLVKAPAPLFWVRFRGIGYHREIAPVPGVDRSYRFNHLTEGYFEIPGERPLNGAEGFSYHSGEYHFKVRSDEIYVYYTSWVVPSVDLLPQIAAPYIERGYLALLKGMFSLK